MMKALQESSLVEKILISLTTIFDTKVSSIEEMQDLKNLTVEKLHEIITTYEMRKESPSYIGEDTFKDTSKGKEKEEIKEPGYVSDEEEANFMKKLQVGIGRFRGKLPFKFFFVEEFVTMLLDFLIEKITRKGRI